MLFRIEGGLPHATAKAALSKIRALSPTAALPLVTAPDPNGVYWVQIDDGQHESLFRGFLRQQSVLNSEHTALPGGGTLRPVPKQTRPDFYVGSIDELMKRLGDLFPGMGVV